jgi:FAD:protein FMN transferase
MLRFNLPGTKPNQMIQTRILMGMPVTLEIVDAGVNEAAFNEIYAYFESVDERFSTYKEQSEISKINRREIALEDASEEMQNIFALAEQTRTETDGYFNIERNGQYDPSGIVKGWAILNASQILLGQGYQNFYVDAGGDAEVHGMNSDGQPWRVGIRNPFNMYEIVKVLSLRDCGVATSGTSIRGQHIYNPHQPNQSITDIMSLTVIGPDVYEADRFATAAFAMGKEGIYFIEQLNGFEGYMIDQNKQAMFTSGFERFRLHVEVHR